MSTKAQTTANIANAQHSTGPKTESGKAASSLNHLSHGLTGAAFRSSTGKIRTHLIHCSAGCNRNIGPRLSRKRS